MGLVRRYVPMGLQPVFLKAVPWLKKVYYFGVKRYCPVCHSWLRSFRRHGADNRPDSRCPVCGSLERFRFIWLFLDKHPDICASGKVLHFAPERQFEQRFRNTDGLDYLSADLNPARAMVQVDIADIQYDDGTFDLIFCLHVLEHVPDDRKAMRELYRVLKDDGLAIIQVPITAEQTYEDASITEPTERERVFGQRDHLRRYGMDVQDRLTEAGFKVTRFCSADVTNPRGIRRMGLKAATLFLCKKSNSSLRPANH